MCWTAAPILQPLLRKNLNWNAIYSFSHVAIVLVYLLLTSNFLKWLKLTTIFFSRFTSLPQTEGFWKAYKDPRYKGTYSYCLIRHSEVIKIISIKCIITYPSCTYCTCCEERALKLPIFHFNISQNCFKTPKIYLI